MLFIKVIFDYFVRQCRDSSLLFWDFRGPHIFLRHPSSHLTYAGYTHIKHQCSTFLKLSSLRRFDPNTINIRNIVSFRIYRFYFLCVCRNNKIYLTSQPVTFIYFIIMLLYFFYRYPWYSAFVQRDNFNGVPILLASIQVRACIMFVI